MMDGYPKKLNQMLFGLEIEKFACFFHRINILNILDLYLVKKQKSLRQSYAKKGMVKT